VPSFPSHMQSIVFAAVLSWSPIEPHATLANVITPRASSTLRASRPVCTTAYGRIIGAARSQGAEVTAKICSEQAAALLQATKRLSAHDKLSLSSPASPMDAIPDAVEGYYEEYFLALQEAVHVLMRHSNSVMLGIMGDNPAQAVSALRTWQEELNLAQPPLQIIDDCSLNPVELPDRTVRSSESKVPTYLKFNSASQFNMLKAHEGPFRGVIITANLREGTTRQYGGLPLSLFAATAQNTRILTS